MKVLECINTRHSSRKFTKEPVSKEQIMQVVEAGRQAPTGGNTQFTHFIVITKPEVLNHMVTLVQEEFGKMPITEKTLPYMVNIIKAAAAGTFIFNYGAPALILVANKKTYGNNMADSACAMQNMMLAANALDLGSCWVNQPRWLCENEVMISYLRQFGLQEDEVICAGLVLGHPDTADGLPFRKVLERKGNPVTIID